MKSLCLAMAILGMGVIFSSVAVQAQAMSAEGYWLTENKRSVIRIARCANEGDMLCGHVHWIIEGGMQYDEKNPDNAKRTQKMCGLPILTGFKRQTAQTWGDGKIYKADDGDIYNATMQILPSGNLMVRGYIGMPLFGKSQTWSPVKPSDYPACR